MEIVVFIDYEKSPIGWVEITASESGVCSVYFVDKKSKKTNSNAITDQCKEQLSEYFKGQRKSFDLPLDQTGTAFQKEVWQQLCHLDFGQTASYGEIAHKLDNPKAVRAVGAANGKNPISVIVPCHRVIGANGTLTGYAGGLERKKWLLQHEGIAC